MTFRFRSGSVTSSSRSRNRSVASTNSSGSWSFVNRSRTCAASFSRSSPLSTKMQVNRSPIARWTSSAATVESTPPESPSTTRPSPTCSRIRATLSSTNEAMVQSPRHPQTPNAKLRRMLVPLLGVHDFGVEQQPVEPALALLDRGHRRIGRRGDDLEPWRRRRDEVAVARPDLQRRLDRIEQRRAVDEIDDGVPELTLRRALDLAAKRVGHELHPVADPQCRRAQVQDAGIGLRRARIRHALGPAGQDDARRADAARSPPRTSRAEGSPSTPRVRATGERSVACTASQNRERRSSDVSQAEGANARSETMLHANLAIINGCPT